MYNYNYGSINPNGKSPSIGLNLFSLIKTLVEKQINLKNRYRKMGIYGHGRRTLCTQVRTISTWS